MAGSGFKELYPNTGRRVRPAELQHIRDTILAGDRLWAEHASTALGRSVNAVHEIRRKYLPELDDAVYRIFRSAIAAPPLPAPAAQPRSPVRYNDTATVMARYEFRQESIAHAIKRVERKIDAFLADLGVAFVEADQMQQIGLWSDENGG